MLPQIHTRPVGMENVSGLDLVEWLGGTLTQPYSMRGLYLFCFELRTDGKW